MKLRQFALAAALVVSGAAHAAPTILDLSTGSASFSSAAASQDYQFTLPFGSTAGLGTVTAAFVFGTGYDISSVTFGSSTQFVTTNTVAPGVTFDLATLFSGPLAAGTYNFTVKGTSFGGGQYTGNITVTPVPEAETYALALAGLGVVGLVAARRRKAQ